MFWADFGAGLPFQKADARCHIGADSPRDKHPRNRPQRISGEGRERKKVMGGKEKSQTGLVFFPDLLWLTAATLICQKQLANSKAVRTPCSKLPPYKPGQPTRFEPVAENSCYSGHINSHLSPPTSSTSRSPYLQISFSAPSFGIILLLRGQTPSFVRSYSGNQRGCKDSGETKSHVNFYSPGNGIFLRARSLVENYQLRS